MNFNSHSKLEGKHALLGASKYHWINYSDDKLIDYFNKQLNIARGTELHAIAKELIRLKIRLQKSKKTFNSYVNDAIGFNMIPEQILYYSDNCFGTADAILFKNDFLRIHDLKTGVTPASMTQLEIYAGLFCLEYSVNPSSIGIELRIYQNDEIQISDGNSDRIEEIMDKIVSADKVLEKQKLKLEV